MPKRKEPTAWESSLNARAEALRNEVEALARSCPNPDSALGNAASMQFNSPMLSHSLNHDQKQILLLERELEQLKGGIGELRAENVRLRQRLLATERGDKKLSRPHFPQPTPSSQSAIATQLAMVAESALARQSSMGPLPSPSTVPAPAAPADDKRHRRASVDGAAVLMTLNSPPPQLTLVDEPRPVETSAPIASLASLRRNRNSSSSSLQGLSSGSSHSTLPPNFSSTSLASLGGLSEGTSEELNRLLRSPGLLAQLAEKTFENAASCQAPSCQAPSPLSPKNGSTDGHSPLGHSPKGMSPGSNFSPKLMSLYSQVQRTNLASNLAAWTGGRLGGHKMDPRQLPV